MKKIMLLPATVALTAPVALAGGDAEGATAVCCKGGGPLFAMAAGFKEIGPNGERGAGDEDGRASLSAIIDKGKFCYGLAVKNIEKPVAAHIHRGAADENGPVVLTLKVPSTVPGARSDCIRIKASLVRSIRRSPASYYLNVHTPDFPAGAARGQMFSRKR